MSTGCKVRHVVMPTRSSTARRRSRVMRNLHTKRRRHSSGRGRKHSRKHHRRHSRRRGRKHSRKHHHNHSRGRGRKHSKKHSRKHHRRHRRHLRNLGGVPKLDSYALRDIILGNSKPRQEIIEHIPEIERLHELIIKFRKGSEHGFNMPKRMEIRGKLMPKLDHTDQQTHQLQREAMASIIEELEDMGLERPPLRTQGERTQQKQYDVDTEALLKSGR